MDKQKGIYNKSKMIYNEGVERRKSRKKVKEMAQEIVQDFIRRVVGYSFEGKVRVEANDQKAIVGSAEKVVKYLDTKDYKLYVKDFKVEGFDEVTIYA